MSETVHISAVAFQEGGVWVVQGIEYDIVAHAEEVTDVPRVFMRAVVENASITQHLGRQPLEGIKPAPACFKAMFDEAAMELRRVREFDQPAGLPFAALEIRVSEHA